MKTWVNSTSGGGIIQTFSLCLLSPPLLASSSSSSFFSFFISFLHCSFFLFLSPYSSSFFFSFLSRLSPLPLLTCCRCWWHFKLTIDDDDDDDDECQRWPVLLFCVSVSHDQKPRQPSASSSPQQPTLPRRHTASSRPLLLLIVIITPITWPGSRPLLWLDEAPLPTTGEVSVCWLFIGFMRSWSFNGGRLFLRMKRRRQSIIIIICQSEGEDTETLCSFTQKKLCSEISWKWSESVMKKLLFGFTEWICSVELKNKFPQTLTLQRNFKLIFYFIYLCLC